MEDHRQDQKRTAVSNGSAHGSAHGNAHGSARADVPSAVARFREEYRAREMGPHYRGWLHFAFTSVGSLVALALAVSRVSNVRAVEWLTLPVAFLFANFAEYAGHRGPMHHATKPLAILFQRHTKQHHRFFTDEEMEYESSRDFKMVLFPPAMLLFFLGGIAAPLAGVLFLVATANVAWLFVAVAIAYFLTYEGLHFAYHLGARSFVGGSALLRSLRRHHQRHHDQALMQRWNFNITFPIADLVCGTFWSGARDTQSAPGRDGESAPSRGTKSEPQRDSESAGRDSESAGRDSERALRRDTKSAPRGDTSATR